MKKYARLLLALILLIAIPFNAYGAIEDYLPEQSRDFYVYDELNILNSEDIDYIINVNENLRKETESQVVVAIVKTFHGYERNEYANALFRKWKIGGAKENNGILMVYAIEDRNMEILTGYGAEEIVPDAVASRIFRNIVSYFPSEDYDASEEQKTMYHDGIIEGFNEIMDIYSKFYDVELNSNPPVLGEHLASDDAGDVAFLAFIVIAFILITIIRNRNRRYRRYRRMYPPTYRRKSFFDDDDDDFFGGFGGGSFGGGSGGGFGGGGFSGGGGSSGGGGAGGGW